MTDPWRHAAAAEEYFGQSSGSPTQTPSHRGPNPKEEIKHEPASDEGSDPTHQHVNVRILRQDSEKITFGEHLVGKSPVTNEEEGQHHSQCILQAQMPRSSD
jgi:hypothetical protein